MSVSHFLKRELVVIFAAIAGISLLVNGFIVNPQIRSVAALVSSYSVILVTFAYGIGAIVAVRYNARTLIKRTPTEWYMSIIFLIVFVIVFLSSLVSYTNVVFTSMYSYLVAPLEALSLTFTAFAGASIAFRGVRGRNKEAIAFVVGAFSVAVGNVSMLANVFPPISGLRSYFVEVLALGGTIGVAATISLGLILNCFRVILGYQRQALGVEEG